MKTGNSELFQDRPNSVKLIVCHGLGSFLADAFFSRKTEICQILDLLARKLDPRFA